MDLDFAFICESSEFTTDNIDAFGIGYNGLVAAELPALHEELHIIAQVRGNAADAGTHYFTCSLIDADGNHVIEPVLDTLVIPRPNFGFECIGRMRFILRDIVFRQYGAYAIHLTLDGNPTSRIPITLVKESSLENGLAS